MAAPLEAVIKRTASNKQAVARVAQKAEVSARREIRGSPFFQSLKNFKFKNHSQTLQPMVAPIAGFAAAFTEISLLFPTEYCKVQLQLNRGNADFSLAKHLKQRGMRIYQALPPMLIGAPLQGLLRFSCLDAVQRSSVLQKISSPTLSGLTAGVSAGIVESVLVVTPMETVKTKLIDSKKGLLEGVRHVVKHQGVSGLYSGLVPTIAKSASNQAIRFVVFSQYKAWLLKERAQKKLSVFESLSGGVLAGLIGSLLNTPVDTVKSRMQSLERSRYKNSLDCVLKMVKEEGFLSLYKGLLMRSARVVPGQGIIFLVYEQASGSLNKMLGV